MSTEMIIISDNLIIITETIKMMMMAMVKKQPHNADYLNPKIPRL